MIYRRGVDGGLELESTGFGGGRIEVSEGSGGAVYTPNYFITDHLGSTRAVVTPDGAGGFTVLEQNDYLPFGGRWEQPGAAITDNRFRFSGKEDQTTGGLPYQDFGARFFGGKLPIWTAIDPLAEKRFQTTPYAYVSNNPVNIIDLDGRDEWEVDKYGNIISRIEKRTHDAFYVVEQIDGKWQRMAGDQYSITFDHGTVVSQNTYKLSSDPEKSFDVYKVIGDEQGTALFNFMSDNITGSSSMVEIGQIMTGIKGDDGVNFISTSHDARSVHGMDKILNGPARGYTIREVNHSHPTNSNPSNRDYNVVKNIIEVSKRNQQGVPLFHIYDASTKEKIQFWNQK